MTFHAPGRHRASTRPVLPVIADLPGVSHLGSALTATCRGGVVVLAGAGLVATLATTASPEARPSAVAVAPEAAPAPPVRDLADAELTAVRTAVPGTATFSKKTMAQAAKLKGTPYRRGGTTPRGFDCSGFTQYVVRHASGIALPRTSNGQLRAVRRVSRASARPGDLVFFTRGGRVYHVALYAGSGYIYDSPKPGKKVTKRKIWTSKVTFGRIR